MVSEDSGKSFEGLGRSREVHGDYHALWINPKDPDHIVTGNDGGLAISRDRGETWQFVSTLPLGAVLPRGRRHGAAVQRLRRPAGQRLVAGAERDLGERRPAQRQLGAGGRRRRLRHAARPAGLDDGLLHVPGRRAGALEPAHRRDEARQAAGAQAGERSRAAALQLELRPRTRPLRAGHGLLRQPVRPQDDGPGRHLDGDQPRPDDRQSRVAAAVEDRRPDAGRLGRRELHHHHRHRPEPPPAGRDLGGDGRRPPPRDPRRRQELDERREERVQSGGVPANTWIPHILPSQIRRRLGLRGVRQPPAVGLQALRLPHGRLGQDLEEPGPRMARTSRATPSRSSRTRRTATCFSWAPSSASSCRSTAARAGCPGVTACPPPR